MLLRAATDTTARSDPPAGLQHLLVQAALDSLPDRACALLGSPPTRPLQRHATRNAVRLLAQPLRLALRNGIAAQARRRLAD